MHSPCIRVDSLLSAREYTAPIHTTGLHPHTSLLRARWTPACILRPSYIHHGRNMPGQLLPAACGATSMRSACTLNAERPRRTAVHFFPHTRPPDTCYNTSLSIQTSPLLPLRFRSTRVLATQASVCWRAQSTVDSLFFIDVPTNLGPRSFHAWPVRRCSGHRSTHVLQLLQPGLPKSTNPYPISRDLDPGMSSSDNTLSHPLDSGAAVEYQGPLVNTYFSIVLSSMPKQRAQLSSPTWHCHDGSLSRRRGQ
jgi:hypothetical protein